MCANLNVMMSGAAALPDSFNLSSGSVEKNNATLAHAATQTMAGNLPGQFDRSSVQTMDATPQTMMVGATMLPGSPVAMGVQAHVDRKICKLRAQVQALCAQRNTLSLVSRLPPEILSTIFIQYARKHHEASIDATRKVPHWVNVSYVCRRWRNIALGCPILWGHFFMVSRSWTEELLSRSKTAPLRIRFRDLSFPEMHWDWSQTNPEEWPINRLKPVLAQSWRIQELELMVQRPDPEQFTSMFSSPAPLLQSLDLDWHVSLSERIPNHLPIFGGIVPSLRRLKLSGCPMPHPIPMLCSLTTLILERLYRLTMTGLRAMLHSAQSITHLELRGCFIEWNGTEPYAHSIDAPDSLRPSHLLRLAIDEPLCVLIKLLTWLRTPSQTQVRIRNSSELHPDTSHTWSILRPLLVKRFFTSEDNSTSYVQSWTVDVRLNETVTFTASKSDSDGLEPRLNFYDLDWAEDWDCNVPLKFVLTLFGLSVQGAIQDFTQDARHSGFLMGLRSVYLSAESVRGTDSPFSEDILALIPELSRITVKSPWGGYGGKDPLKRLLSSLSITFHCRAEDQGQNVLHCPSGKMLASALEELVISDATFRVDDPQAAVDLSQHNCRVSDLYGALAIRKQRGYPIKRLILTGCCNLFKEDVAKLSDVAAEVVWDGVEGPYHGTPLMHMVPVILVNAEEDSEFSHGDEGQGEDSSGDDNAHGDPAEEG